jgi:transposase
MTLGKRLREWQLEAFVVASDLPTLPSHPRYTALTRLLGEKGPAQLLEKTCAPLLRDQGPILVASGVFFRMLFFGYFEAMKSHRSFPWRCTDGYVLGRFLGLGPTDPVPNHA